MSGKRWQQEQLGKRLPEPAPPPQPACFRDGDGLRHDNPIRFDLQRYGRRVAALWVCGYCVRALMDADPLTLPETA